MKVFSIVSDKTITPFLETYYSCKKVGLNKQLSVVTDSKSVSDTIKEHKLSICSVNIYDNINTENVLFNELKLKDNESFLFIEVGTILERNPFSLVQNSLFTCDLIFLKEHGDYSLFSGVYSKELQEMYEEKGTFDLPFLSDLLKKKESNICTLLPSIKLLGKTIDLID